MLCILPLCCRRGFIPKYCVDKGGDAQTEQSLVSPRLFLKLAIEHSYPLQPQEASAAAHVARIYTAALLILPRIEGLQTATAFLMQDRQKLAAIAEAAGSPHSFSSTSSEPPQALLPALPLEQINDYFGSEAALYFGWLRFYSLSLCVPAVAGVGLFALQMHNGEVCRGHTSGKRSLALHVCVRELCQLFRALVNPQRSHSILAL